MRVPYAQGRHVHIGELGSRLGRQHSQGGKKGRYFSLSFGHSFGIIALIWYQQVITP